MHGVDQLISPASNWLYSYDAKGTELWKLAYGGLGFSLTPRPVTGSGLFFMSTGFMRAELLAISLETSPPSIVWKATKGVPTMPSPVHHDGLVYMVSDSGILASLDAKTGQEVYRERLGGEFSSSPTVADGCLFLSNRMGKTYVVKSGREFKILEENTVSGKIMASLAGVDGRWYLRSDSALYCLGK